MTSQLAKSSNYTHDVKEQDSACQLAQQYPFAQKQQLLLKNNRFSVVLIASYSKTIGCDPKTMAVTLNNTSSVDKQYIFKSSVNEGRSDPPTLLIWSGQYDVVRMAIYKLPFLQSDLLI